MKFYQETTNWKDNTPNGVYLLNEAKNKMYAYIAPGQKEVKRFKNFIRIDPRGRTFKSVKNTFGYKIEEDAPINPQWVITGSKGDKYIVEKTEHGLTCTCSGFRFRGGCKHVTEVELAQN